MPANHPLVICTPSSSGPWPQRMRIGCYLDRTAQTAASIRPARTVSVRHCQNCIGAPALQLWARLASPKSRASPGPWSSLLKPNLKSSNDALASGCCLLARGRAWGCRYRAHRWSSTASRLKTEVVKTRDLGLKTQDSRLDAQIVMVSSCSGRPHPAGVTIAGCGLVWYERTSGRDAHADLRWLH